MVLSSVGVLLVFVSYGGVVLIRQVIRGDRNTLSIYKMSLDVEATAAALLGMDI